MESDNHIITYFEAFFFEEVLFLTQNFREPNTNENYDEKSLLKIFLRGEIHERNTRNDTTTRGERTVMEVWRNNLLHIMNENRITRLGV
jgi:hypothetical protein